MNKKQTCIVRGDIGFTALVCVASMATLAGGARLFWGKDAAGFFKGWVRNPLQIGAPAPCSVFVAKEITKHVQRCVAERDLTDMTPLRVLEVGGGSGIFSGKLEDILQEVELPYTLDIIEIDAGLANTLQKRFVTNEHIKVHCLDAADWNPDYKYDFIVSSVPFTNLDTVTVERILTNYRSIVKPGGFISYVELMWFAPLKEMVLRGESKEKFVDKLNTIKHFREQFSVEKVDVWMNVTPAHIHHLQIS